MPESTVFVSTSSFGKEDSAPLRFLEERGIAYSLNPYGRTLKEQEIGALLGDAEGLIAGTEPLTRAVLEAAPRLRAFTGRRVSEKPRT